ncbi:MAG: rRNA maturation RNase YbeY [Bryobacterales bacterium]|nr:rRNA maturation RNase YbeY [Bryobacterales bacterium]
MERPECSDDPGCHFESAQQAVPFDGRPVADFLDRLAQDLAPGLEFSVVVVDDDAVRRANRQFRKTDRKTDVLAFPDGEHGNLGDIMIAAGRAAEQAVEQRHSVETEVQILALHGLLHLKGYDHDSDGGEMLAVEGRLRQAYGLPLGLIERATATRREDVRSDLTAVASAASGTGECDSGFRDIGSRPKAEAAPCSGDCDIRSPSHVS